MRIEEQPRGAVCLSVCQTGLEEGTDSSGSRSVSWSVRSRLVKFGRVGLCWAG